MSSGTYLGTKSEEEFEHKEGDYHINRATPTKQASITFFAFASAGLVPLLPYLLFLQGAFRLSIVFMFLTLFVIGAIRGKFTGKNQIVSGLESLLVGGLAAVVAYATGDIIAKFI